MSSDTTTWTFSDLVAVASYNLWVFGLGQPGTSPVDHTISIAGDGLPVSFSQTGAANTLIVNSALGDNTRTLESYAISVVASGAGAIVITATPGARDFWNLAGVAIQPVQATAIPEPATWLTLATGVLGLLAYGWRRRQRAA